MENPEVLADYNIQMQNPQRKLKEIAQNISKDKSAEILLSKITKHRPLIAEEEDVGVRDLSIEQIDEILTEINLSGVRKDNQSKEISK